MSDPRSCDYCGDEFETITRCRLHQKDCDGRPDYQDPFSPDRNGEREMMCLHCGETVNEADIVYERRFGNPFALWYCPTEGCDGAGVGFDLHPAENFEANRRLEDSDAD